MNLTKHLALLSLLLLAPVGCSPAGDEADAEAISLLGDPLRPLTDSAESHAEKVANLDAAKARYDAAPDDLDAAIWYGRRLAYLYRYREAVEVYTKALETHPDEPRLLRHRGHRYLTLREFTNAVRDLSRAAELVDGTEDEIEPDGIPNARNQPTSTLHFNIWYHLGLAYFCTGEFSQSYNAFGACYGIAQVNADSLVAATHWLYVTSRRIKLDADAEALLEPINLELDVIENRDYLDLLMMYKGHFTPEQLLESKEGTSWATRAFGVAHYKLSEGDPDTAHDLYLQIVEAGPWPAFGALCAEAELARL